MNVPSLNCLVALRNCVLCGTVPRLPRALFVVLARPGVALESAGRLRASWCRYTFFLDTNVPCRALSKPPPLPSPGGVRGRSRRRSAAREGILNANANANGKRAFAFVASMARSSGPLQRTAPLTWRAVYACARNRARERGTLR